MERFNFTYAYENDERVIEKNVEMGIEGEYVCLDQLANELKRFLNAAGFSVDSLVINDSFGSDDE